MTNELSASQSLRTSPPIEPGLALEKPRASIIKEEVLQALKNDDWSTFEALTLGSDAEINIVAERFENGENCFHVAMKSGSYSIVSNLMMLSYGGVPDLINDRDDAGHTPLMYAVQAKTDNPELIKSMINAGATEDLSDALATAAVKGHIKTVECLIENCTDRDAERALENAIAQHHGQRGSTAAKLLISMGVKVSNALPETITANFEKDLAKRLLLLGANGAAKLAQLAGFHDAAEIEPYIKVGVDVSRTLAILASKQPKPDIKAMKLVAATQSKLQDKSASAIYESALLRLCRNRNLPEIKTFCAALDAINPDHLDKILHQLIARGDSDTLITLISAGLANPDDILMNVALTGNFAATKALLHTSTNVSSVLQHLSKIHTSGYLNTSEAIELLVLAGADSSVLPDSTEALININERNTAISQSSQSQKNDALITATMQYNDVVDAVSFIKAGADKLVALKALKQTNSLEGIRTLLKADDDPCALLIDRLKANDMELVQAILKAKDISSDALNYLIKKGDLQTAAACIPVLTDGVDLLLQAVQDNDEELAKLLISIGADGPKLLASLMHTKQRELAGRLLTWGGVDINTARMRLTEITTGWSPASVDLGLLGADLSIAVMRAFESNNIEAAQKLVNAVNWAGSRSILRVIDDKTVAEDVKTARLKLILQWNVSTDEAMQTLAERNDTDNLRRLVRLGASAESLMMDLSKRGDIRRIAALIVAGADIARPMETLQASNEQEALRTLTVALAVAQSDSILAHARANNLPYRINPSGSVELI
ncbi:hypothetical protein BOTU111921_15195 [Bordetella tumbae]|uniref:ankyrin repeat domain-containing protein n=1 Tax=Bordetella tumbae TaxID=1649139 RepID=UPI0039EEF701